MLTTNDFKSSLNVDPNVVELTRNNLLNSGKVQYYTNYVIALDKDLVVEQFQHFEKNKNKINNYLFENKSVILENYTEVLQKYIKK
jgi:hypothetical protein